MTRLPVKDELTCTRAALTGEKVFVTFTPEQGADDHGEVGARTLYHARSFGWLDHILRGS
jgi:hypothetical protein